MIPVSIGITYKTYGLRYSSFAGNTKSRIINAEILRGIEILSEIGTVEEWLAYMPSSGGRQNDIPRLLLDIGEFEGAIPAKLDINGRSIPNTQVLIAGATGSGKSNLIAVLVNEIRELSVESEHPVNFLLFDYKGEFSDPSNNHWLSYFSVDRACILKPVEKPLPFTPFKDFTGKAQNEINLYATELANALCAIDKATISAKMSDRLTDAVISAYNHTTPPSPLLASPTTRPAANQFILIPFSVPT